jgi:oligopeptide/dipeptide ABC transporter ATP-binding protein
MIGGTGPCRDNALLTIQDLQAGFETDAGLVPVVDGVSIQVSRARTVALVGESGCGKSVTALSVLRLIPQPPGRIVGGRMIFNDRTPDAPPTRYGATAPIDLLQISDQALRRIRGNRIAMIFQEPMTALNPVYSIGEQVVEAVELHQGLRGKAAWEAAVEALRRVGIADAARRSRDYPHQLSGGMRQRVMIAMALSCRPALLIADEPTTALDVTVQRQILELLRAIQAETGMSILLITHDLGVVAEAADDVYVMYAGRIVEHGPVAEVLAHPLHPYTQGLLRCMPRLSQRKERLEVIPGTVPDPRRLPSGCRFHPRCPLSADRARTGDRQTVPVKSEISEAVLRRCVEEYEAEPSGRPTLRELKPSHFVACWEAERPQ